MYTVVAIWPTIEFAERNEWTSLTSDSTRRPVSFPPLIARKRRTGFQSFQQGIHDAFLVIIHVQVHQSLFLGLALQFFAFRFLFGFTGPANLLLRLAQLVIIFMALLKIDGRMKMLNMEETKTAKRKPTRK